MNAAPFSGRLILDLSSGIAGGYCTKILADAGFEVVKVEDSSGDPLRRHSSTGLTRPGEDSALFQYLHASKKSIVSDGGKDGIEELLVLARNADGIVWSIGSEIASLDRLQPTSLHDAAPHTTVVAITPFGLNGPWAHRPWTEFTLQAWSGGPSLRGTEQTPPLAMGGDNGLWVAGLFAAVAFLTSLRRGGAYRSGDLVDVSILESLIWTHTTYPVTYFRMANKWNREGRHRNLPGIHRTLDGRVAFMVASAQQWFDFCAMIEKPEWADDLTLRFAPSRWARSAQLSGEIDAWTSIRTTAEIVQFASLLRVPAAPVAEPSTISGLDHFIARGFFTENPHGFTQPDLPYLISGAGRRGFEPAPKLGQHTKLRKTLGRPEQRPTQHPRAAELPLEGLRVLDVTTFWAGPSGTNLLAMAGADVIHLESANRLDGSRQNNTVRDIDDDAWWEWTPSFHGANVGKLDLAVDLQTSEGRTLFLDLVAKCDALVENYSPRVMDNFGFTYAALRELNPRLIMIRMPAFGVTGPWRDMPGYAQTIEASSGLVWLTGFPDSGPELPNGLCDPVAGAHGVIALLVALEHRRRTGKGSLVEAPMIRGALNIAAELVVEWSAYGIEMQRYGNRNPFIAPQGLYRTCERPSNSPLDRWVAISIENDEQWIALCEVLDVPALALDPKLRKLKGRWASHDLIDQHINEWCSERTADEIVDALWDNGVPVAKLMRPYEQVDLEQEIHRRFFEEVDHPVTGRTIYVTYPARFSSGPDRFHRRPAPLLGQHNDEILSGLLGLPEDHIAELRKRGVIGNRPSRGDRAAT